MSGERPSPSEELTGGPVTTPRQAASVIVLRDAPGAPEVLLVQRNPAARFMGGAWVFPGGSVSAEDEGHAAAGVRELREEAGLEIDGPDALVAFSRWITPARIKIRFDTWFFVTEAPSGAEATPDGSETVAARWITPADALAEGRRGTLSLMFPTLRHLEELAAFDSTSEAIRAARTRKIEAVEPRVVERDGVATVLMPGEPGYDDAAPEPGAPI